jgi:hypothetical protein
VSDDPSRTPQPMFSWRTLAGLFDDAWKRQRRRRWFVGLALLLMAVALLIISSGGGGNGSVKPPAGFEPQPVQIARISDTSSNSGSLDSRYALFRQPAATERQVRWWAVKYPSLKNWLATKSGVGGQSVGASDPKIHLVHTSGGLVWVFAGRAGACAVIEHKGGANAACGKLTGRHTRVGASSGSGSGNEISFGVVPNGVETVTIPTGDGPEVTVPVTDNTYRVAYHSQAAARMMRRMARRMLSVQRLREKRRYSPSHTTG